ncbi:MAG: hypothetical protein HY324_01395, partial [Chlamydiia bacterium]|nr:hypothetical protein [Chlamydiia bacterium]
MISFVFGCWAGYFVITELGKPVDAIQVCYADLQDEATKTREIEALLECLEELNLPSGKILTLSIEDHFSLKGRMIHF